MSEREWYTAENGPLGPVAVHDTDATEDLALLYDDKVKIHIESQEHPPTFIVGRRGSGKTALLLSKEFDRRNLSIRLSTSDAFNEVHQSLVQLKSRMLVTVETAAKLWAMLLWAPIAVRVAQLPDDRRDPHGHLQKLWQSTRELREAAEGSETPDDLVLQAMTSHFLDEFHRAGRIVSIDNVASSLNFGGTPWSTTQKLAREIVKARKLPVYVLIDSLENLGDLIDEIEATLQGLFHLAGRNPYRPGQFRIQCCFPSELWPKLSQFSSNPTKDFAGRLVLQWPSRDLVHLCSTRLAHFLESSYPGHFTPEYLARPRLLTDFLPPTVVNNSGSEEQTLNYILRHTQLLPRQVLHILNRVLQEAINADPGSPPRVQPEHVVGAVMEIEGLLCSEVFSAHRYRYPVAEEVASHLLPKLPFRFNEDFGHKVWNKCGIRHELDLNWAQARDMLYDVGIIGRLVDESDQYLEAEFAYTIAGRVTLSPNEEYCLHPLFVREFRSASLPATSANPDSVVPKSVHPVKTRPPQQGRP